MSGKSKRERRVQRKEKEQKQEANRRTPRLSKVGEALTAAILETPYAHPRQEKFGLYPELTREQIILGGACYYYAAAGTLLLMTRALELNMPTAYSLVAGMLKTSATTPEGEHAELVVGFTDGYDPLRVEAGDMHAWIQLHDGDTFHLIDFTARNWPIIAAVRNTTPAPYPDYVHIANLIKKELIFTNSPYAYQPGGHITEHMRQRMHTDEGVDPAVMDVALRAAGHLNWDTNKLRRIAVRESGSIDIPVIHLLPEK